MPVEQDNLPPYSMKKRDHSSRSDNPQFIPGIYNYCDRWCERCPFTARCMTCAMEQENRNPPTDPPSTDNAAFWKKLEGSLKLTRQMLVDLVEAHGIKLDPDEAQKLRRDQRQKRQVATKHPLAIAALNYTRMVDEWFKAGEALLSEKEEEIFAQSPLGVAGVKEEVASLTDVVEILRWYQHQIYVKLMRGLDADPAPDSGYSPRDADGSAKVALIAMDRSIAAWLRMKEFFPEKTDSILSMLVHLDRLRRGTEKEFPDARSFVRPGFDTEIATDPSPPQPP